MTRSSSRLFLALTAAVAATAWPAVAFALTPSNGLYYGSCRAGAPGKPCTLSFWVGANGTEITKLSFQVPTCIDGNHAVSPITIRGDSFTLAVNFPHSLQAKVAIGVKFSSSSHAAVTLTTSCLARSGATARTTQTRTLTLNRAEGK